MKRRDFLMSAAAVAAAGITRPAAAAARVTQQGKQAALNRISIMSLNFQNMLKVPDTQPGPERTLELFDYPTMIADTYGVHKVEFQHYHLASTEESYLKELRKNIEKAKSQAQQFNLEFADLNISHPTLRNRLLAIDLTKQFVDHAVVIGAKRVMINQGTLTPENKAYAIETLKTMVNYGKSKGIIVSVETRGGGGGRGRAGAPGAPGAPGAAAGSPTPAGAAAAAGPGAGAGAGAGANAGMPPAGQPAAPARGPAPTFIGTPPASGPPTWMLLAEVIESAGSYSNVDVGGAAAANQEDLHACLKRMFPFTAGTMHTRVSQNWDLATAMKYLEKDLGYKGLYTIEANGGHAGTKQIYDVVVATLTSLNA
jgi:hypothetical protein